MAHVAHAHGGFSRGYSKGHAATLEGVYTKDGPVHEQAGADVVLPSLCPRISRHSPAGPPRKSHELGEPAALVQAAVAAAERMYNGAEDIPDAVGSRPTTGWFCSATCCGLLLQGRQPQSSLADRITALGGGSDESAAECLTRRAIGSDLPRLPSRWDDENDAVRFALHALAALCGTPDQRVLSGLAALPASAGGSRADVVSLVAALLRDDRERLIPALDRLGSLLPRIAEKAASPSVDLHGLGLAIPPDLVLEDVASGIAVERDLP